MPKAIKCSTAAALTALALGCAVTGSKVSAAPTTASTDPAVSRTAFGTLPDGTAVDAVTLSNAHGLRLRILSYGALIQMLEVPDAQGRSDDVVLGYDTLDGYVRRSNYFGVSVGRYANRIGGAAFALDGKTYHLSANDGPNSLHGGTKGFGERLWTIAGTTGGSRPSVTLTYRSPDGEEGFPGNLTAEVTYALGADNTLTVTYRATTDAPTVVNLTNHAYFNLGGARSGRDIMGERLTIPAQAYTPTDGHLIPTGEVLPVAGTPFDFTRATPIGLRIRDGHNAQILLARGYDHNWVIDHKVSGVPRPVARLEDPHTGRVLDIASTQPGLQFYSGNFSDGTFAGKVGVIYRQGDALCLEPQVFPDTPNQPAFGSARLDPGQTYRHEIVYHFSVRQPHR